MTTDIQMCLQDGYPWLGKQKKEKIRHSNGSVNTRINSPHESRFSENLFYIFFGCICKSTRLQEMQNAHGSVWARELTVEIEFISMKEKPKWWDALTKGNQNICVVKQIFSTVYNIGLGLWKLIKKEGAEGSHLTNE